MDIEEAKKILEELKKNEWGELLNCWDYGEKESKAIETALNELELKEKAIDEMAEEIANITGSCPLDRFDFDSGECDRKCNNGIEANCFKKYFTNKVKLQSNNKSQ